MQSVCVNGGQVLPIMIADDSPVAPSVDGGPPSAPSSSTCMDTSSSSSPPASSSSSSSSSSAPARFEVKKWSAVALWSWDIVVDNCAICRNHIMDLCIECQASQVR
eukprot:GHVT01010077.1.p3 GENE.GHVT01010077.1~~GHVT01010077.1.p3  ORF type:complete len:106 (+),score=42.28 GHVT01010077.1:1255-1572(+)